MGEPSSGGIPRTTFQALVVAILVVAVAQSAAHLALTVGMGRVGTVFDLDRSNGPPDLVSSLALAGAATGAMVLAGHLQGRERGIAALLGLALGVLTVADVLHNGAHPATNRGKIVVGLVLFAGALLFRIGIRSGRRVQRTLVVAGCLLVGAFVVTGLDRFDAWFERERRDPVDELVIVAKESSELIGWSLVALALWDAAAGVARGSSPEELRHAGGGRGESPPTRLVNGSH